MRRLMFGAGLEPGRAMSVPGKLPVGIWPAIRGTIAPAERTEMAALFA